MTVLHFYFYFLVLFDEGGFKKIIIIKGTWVSQAILVSALVLSLGVWGLVIPKP